MDFIKGNGGVQAQQPIEQKEGIMQKLNPFKGKEKEGETK